MEVDKHEMRLHDSAPRRVPRTEVGRITNQKERKRRCCKCSEPGRPVSEEGYKLEGGGVYEVAKNRRTGVPQKCPFLFFLRVWRRTSEKGGPLTTMLQFCAQTVRGVQGRALLVVSGPFPLFFFHPSETGVGARVESRNTLLS